MDDDPNGDAIEISHGNNPFDLFPGYHPPTNEERQEAYQHGLVSIDANGLLDLYRFSERARNEYFAVLDVLRPRLFITHQAASEFYRNRLSVAESRLNAAEQSIEDIKKSLDVVVEKIRGFVNRYQIGDHEQQRLIGLVEDVSSDLADSIRAAGAYDLTAEQIAAATDPVLERLESLLTGRVGDAFDEAAFKQAVVDAMRRKEARIPPGYADVKKGAPERQAGDYLIWRQLINEARLHGRPVLLVTNETKEDWVLEGTSNQILGPRPELVLEMRQEANVQLHTVSVVGLLKEAPGYLGTNVSASTIQEAETFPDQIRVQILFTPEARAQIDNLSEADQKAIAVALTGMRAALETDVPFEHLPGIRDQRISEDTGVVELRNDIRIFFRVDHRSANALDLIVALVVKLPDKT
jgi:hypothetical protein